METCPVKLRHYQQGAIDSIYGYFTDFDGNPIVVAPTGAGKSVIIGKFIQEVLTLWPSQRVLMLTHVRELIAQNYEKLKTFWPDAPAGIYSASIGRRETNKAIIFAGVQSVFKKAYQLGWFDLVIVDECHLIPPKGEGMYNQLLTDLQKINPAIKVIGFSATPYRMKSGHLIGEGGLFTHICYEIGLRTLIDQGHLCPVRPKRMQTDFHMDDIKKHGGEYSLKDMQTKMDTDDLTQSAVKEILEFGQDRKSWLIFCSGVDHAYHVRDALREQGITAETITGKTPKAERERIIIDYKNMRIKALTNADVLTTGFDAPATDLLAILRGTKSPGLWVQIVGRGMRISPETGKTDCLVLDFARNTEEHGPIDKITMSSRGPKKEKGDAPVRICPECNTYMPAVAKQCENCGFEFPPPENQRLASSSDDRELLSFEGLPKEYEINTIYFRRHRKAGSPDMVLASYYAGLREVGREWICIEHSGKARLRAVNWWRTWIDQDTPRTTDKALEILGSAIHLGVPAYVRVDESGKYPQIVGYKFRESA